MRSNPIESFSNELPDLSSSAAFVHLYDNNGKKLNVVLISKPFGADSDYKLYLTNMNKYIFLGITSYMEFPGVPSNPLDHYKEEHTVDTTELDSPYTLDMYFKICDGWLHCFKEPIKYLPANKPLALISESDFVDYNKLQLNNTLKVYDFIYNCPKVKKDSSCDDWVSYNKNWELAYKCLPILCKRFKLKGLLVGRKGCKLPDGCADYLETTGWVDYDTMISLYRKSKFIFLPNVRDASPRVLTEAMALNLPCLINANILGGWKYIESGKTGETFTSEDDISIAIIKLISNMPKYTPRQYIVDNYGPINSGKRLKKFLFENFKDRINVKEDDIDYVTIRNPKL